MIVSFKCKKTELLFNRISVDKKFREFYKIALRKLVQLNASESIRDLKIPPANHLEKLKGDRLEQYSIRINKKYRICFLFYNSNAFKVEIIDYH